jgi:energy-coupling factor transporter transmembrane protein EcfT
MEVNQETGAVAENRVYHPVYALGKGSSSVINDRVVLVAVTLSFIAMIFNINGFYPLVVTGMMILWNAIFPSKEPPGTDVVKLEALFLTLISSTLGKSVIVKIRKEFHKNGNIPKERTKYIP